MENQTELKWYQKPTGVILLLIIFFPVGLYLMWKNDMWTKKTRQIVTAVIAVFLLANSGGKSSWGVSEGDISTKTFNAGYYYLFFKNDHSIEIYQKSSSSSSARGCAADGRWSIEGGKVKVEVVQSYCGTESYTKFNGLYDMKGTCIENERFSFCSK